MKKTLIAFLSFLVVSSIFAYCSMPVTLANAGIPCASGLSTDPSQVHAYLWLQGKADWTTDNTSTAANAPGTCMGGCDSDGMDVMDEGCWNMSSILVSGEDCAVGNPGEYFLLTDWSTSPTGIGYDGCPSAASTERAILLIYDDDGKYVLQSRSQGKIWENWDEIGTSAATDIAKYVGYANWDGDETGNQADIILSSNIPPLYGSYAAGDAPSSPLITGFRLYFYFGCDAPTDFAPSAWVAGGSYPIETSFISNYDFPDAPNGLWVSLALIIDGKDSAIYPYPVRVPDHSIGGHAGGGDDASDCTCQTLFWDEVEPWGTILTQDALFDGTELVLNLNGDPSSYCVDPPNVEHTVQWRVRFGNVVSCWSESYTYTLFDTYLPPIDPVLTSIVDNDPNAQTGLTISYTAGYPATRHDLYRDGYIAQTNFISGSTFSGSDCNVPHGYRIRKFYDDGGFYGDGSSCSYVFSNTISATDQCGPPGELAPGATSDDALKFNPDNITIMWPSYPGATAYRLYRGTPADLPNLPAGTVDNCCTRYDNTGTFIDLSADSPASDSFFWYLVTAYNGSGEGPAGTGRIINTSGGCP